MKNSFKFFLGLISILFLGSCGSESEKTGHKKTGLVSLPVVVEQVSQANTTTSLSYGGDIQPLKKAEASFIIPGKVTFIPYNEGDQVQKGQVLARLDAKDYNIQLKIAQARLMEAKDAHKRLKSLYDKNSLPEKDYISAKAQLQQAEANQEMVLKQVTDTRLVSPASGLITTKHMEEGKTTSPGAPVYTIAVLQQAYAQIAVPESEIGKIKVGQKAKIVVPTLNNKELEGHVKIIAPIADESTRTFQVKILVNNTDLELRGGMLINAYLDSSVEVTRQTLSVPGKAIIKSPEGKSYVFIADMKNKKALKRKISPGKVSGENIEIRSGLQSTDFVIIAGQHKLKDGQSIRVNQSSNLSMNK